MNDLEINYDNQIAHPKNELLFTKLNDAELKGKTVVLINKSDTANNDKIKDIKNFNIVLDDTQYKIYGTVSCKSNEGVQDFINQLTEQVILS